jgi:hypothetical protein
MKKFDISRNRAQDLVKKHNGNRKKIEDELSSVDI